MCEEKLRDFEEMGENNIKSDLELIREKNIRELQAMLSSVKTKIREANEAFASIELPDKNRKKSEKKRRQKSKDSTFRTSAIITSERRRSKRLAGSAPNYKYLDLDEFEENESNLRKKFQYRKQTYIDSDDDLETVYRPATQRTIKRKVSPPPYIHPDEITEEDIANICQKYNKKVYSKYGTSCHQCRQKTTDTKTICRSGHCIGVRGQFCGVCLRDRYGENAEDSLKDPKWACPPCRNICNCSICRNREGKRPTGILAPVAKEKGFKSVKDFLGSLKGRGDFPDQDEIYEEKDAVDVEVEDFKGFSNKEVSYLPLSLLEESISNLTRDIARLESEHSPIQLEKSLDKTIIKNDLLVFQKQIKKRNSNPIKSKVKKMKKLKSDQMTLDAYVFKKNDRRISDFENNIARDTAEIFSSDNEKNKIENKSIKVSTKTIDNKQVNYKSGNEIKKINNKRKRSKLDTSANKLAKKIDYDSADESITSQLAFKHLYFPDKKAYVCSCGIDNQTNFVEENEDFKGF